LPTVYRWQRTASCPGH